MKARKKNKWDPYFPVTAYRMAKAGSSDTDIAKVMKVNRVNFVGWKRTKPELRLALEQGRKELEGADSFPDYIYERLSPELKTLWDKIKGWEEAPDGVTKIELMLQDQGVRVRQQFFLHALCTKNFSPSRAMTAVNITKGELDRWINTDPDFASLVEDIQWHKKNFFEETLVQLCREGVPAAVIYANKSMNADRGYGPAAQEVNVNHSGKVLHGVLDLSELMPYLTDEVKDVLLGAIRRRESEKAKVISMEENLASQIAGGA